MYILTPINEFNYSLKVDGEQTNKLYKSIKKLIPNARVDDKSLFFSAERVTTHITPKDILYIKFLRDISIQIHTLWKLGLTFYGFDIQDVLRIDNTFIICNTTYLMPIHDEHITFIAPMKKPYFSNPELLTLTTLPTQIHCKCFYYSLGVFITYCLTNQYLLVGNEIKSATEINDILEPFYNTKIYWFLKRSLHQDINKRSLLLI